MTFCMPCFNKLAHSWGVTHCSGERAGRSRKESSPLSGCDLRVWVEGRDREESFWWSPNSVSPARETSPRLSSCSFPHPLNQGPLHVLFPLLVTTPFSSHPVMLSSALTSLRTASEKFPIFSITSVPLLLYPRVALLSLRYGPWWNVTVNYVFLQLTSVSRTWAWTPQGQVQHQLLLAPDTERMFQVFEEWMKACKLKSW